MKTLLSTIFVALFVFSQLTLAANNLAPTGPNSVENGPYGNSAGQRISRRESCSAIPAELPLSVVMEPIVAAEVDVEHIRVMEGLLSGFEIFDGNAVTQS
jgi:hypothetical protein